MHGVFYLLLQFIYRTHISYTMLIKLYTGSNLFKNLKYVYRAIYRNYYLLHRYSTDSRCSIITNYLRNLNIQCFKLFGSLDILFVQVINEKHWVI